MYSPNKEQAKTRSWQVLFFDNWRMFKRLFAISAFSRREAEDDDTPVRIKKQKYNEIDSDILSVILSFIDTETKLHWLVI